VLSPELMKETPRGLRVFFLCSVAVFAVALASGVAFSLVNFDVLPGISPDPLVLAKRLV